MDNLSLMAPEVSYREDSGTITGVRRLVSSTVDLTNDSLQEQLGLD